MNVKVQKRIAAEILECGVNRIWIDPGEEERVTMAITRGDVRKLIDDSIIKKRPERSPSKGRARVLHEKRRMGRRRGHGSRKGKSTARLSKKRAWINKVRPLRRKLKELKKSEALDSKVYRKLYRMAGSGAFRSVAHMESYVKEHQYGGQ